jgi:hypothetical protein
MMRSWTWRRSRRANDPWEERIELGRRLVPAFSDPKVAEQLIALLLDPENTAVTLHTALALLERRRPEAVRLVVVASSQADDNTNDWIAGAFDDFRAESLGEDDDFLRTSLARIHQDQNPAYAAAAREWSALFGF